MLKPMRVPAFVAAGMGILLSAAARAQLPPGGPWALRFADEFNDTYAGNITGLDPDKWSPAYPWGRVHNYPAYIRDENIKVNTGGNGLLQLWARRENFGGQPFTSGAVNTNGHLNLGLTGQSGYMEARMKMPAFLGAWPAFWSLQEGWPPEIDVMEFVRNGPGSPNTSPNNYVANVHFSTPSGNASSWSGFKDAGAGDLTAAFHNYGVRWTDSTLTWFIDGRQFHSYTGPAAIAQMQRMYLILNLGVGGWPGDPPPGENVNKSFDIDWVRVWQTSDAAQSTYVGPAGSQNWDVPANWTSGAPKLASTAAVFGNLTGGTSATLDWVDTKTVRGLTFRTGSSYRIGFADDQLVLSAWDSGSTSAPEALIDVQVASGVAAQGTQTIASRVELHDNTRVRNATTNVLTFLGDVHGDGALTLDSGRTRFSGAAFHRGGTNVVGSADATFARRLGTPDSAIQVGTTAGSNSTLRLTSTATTVAASHLRVGDAGGAGTLAQAGGSVTVTGGEVWVGQGAGSTGTYNQDAGSLTLSNWLAIGRQGGTGAYTLGGSAVLNKLGPNNLIIGSLGGTGTFTQTGGTVNVQSGKTLLGEDAGASGTYAISGGAATLGEIILSQRGIGSGTFNLDGGTVTASRVGRAGTGAGTFSFNGGTLTPAANNAAFMQGLTAANVNAGGARIDTNGNSVTIAQRLLDGGGGGGLTKLGAGTLTLGARNTYTGPTTVTGGTLAFGASQRLSALDIGTGATAMIAPGAARTLVMDVLSIAGQPGTWSGTLDVASGAAVVEYADGSPSPLGTVADQVRSARRGGGGITSSRADATTVGVGYAESDFALGPEGGSFGGETVDGTSVLVRAARYGDANLDGVVGADDLLALRRHLGARGARAVWQNGDFNYDGRVSASDLVLLRSNYGQKMPAALPATLSAQAAAVPEPGAAGVALLSLAMLALRRSREW